MSDSVKLDVYQAVKAKLQAITNIKNVLHYNGQEAENYTQEVATRFPQSWIQLTTTPWLPTELVAYNENRTQQQKSGAITISIYLAVFSLKGDDDTFEDDLLLIDEIYRALTMLTGDNFTPLQRTTESDLPTNNNVRVWVQEYTTMLTEQGVAGTLTDAAPVTLTLNISP